MCDFKDGDQIVCVDIEDLEEDLQFIALGAVYTAARVGAGFVHPLGCGAPANMAWFTHRFRPVAKRSDTLSIESFLVIKPGFEEPRRVVEPVKKREGV